MSSSRLILLLLMNGCWAAVYSSYKVIGATLPTGSIVTLRFGLAAVCLLLLWPWLPGRPPRGLDLVKTCGLGVIVFVVGQRLQVYGNQLGTAGNSAVLMAVEPLVTSVAAAVFLRERIGPRRLAGFALGATGVALISGIGQQDFEWTGLTASVIFVSSFVCEAAYSVAGKPIVKRVGVMKMLAISLLAGTAVNFLIDGERTFARAGELSATGWGVLVFLSVICTALGYSVWFVIIRDCPVNVAALTLFAQSLFGVAIAAVWLQEKLDLGQLWGGLVIAAGLAIGLSRQITRRQLSRGT